MKGSGVAGATGSGSAAADGQREGKKSGAGAGEVSSNVSYRSHDAVTDSKQGCSKSQVVKGSGEAGTIGSGSAATDGQGEGAASTKVPSL